MIKYNSLILLDSFANCCDTCKHRPFKSGYSGRKNCGYCETIKQVVCRSNVCNFHFFDESTTKKSIGGMKSQTRWIKKKIEREKMFLKKGV